MPTASIIISAYNAEPFIKETLNSVLEQSHKVFECIVVDDGSTDKTAEIIKSFNDDRIKYIPIANSGGPARPRNIGLERATGDFVFIFDADDVMHPDKLILSLAAFEQYPQADFLFTNYNSIDEQGGLLKANYLQEYQSLWSLLPDAMQTQMHVIPATMLYPALVKINFIGTSSVALRRKAISMSDRFNEGLKNSDDRLFLASFSKNHDAIFINKILHSYRVNASGISKRSFSERGVSKIEALQLIKADCDDRGLRNNIDCQIARDFAAIAYDYKQKQQYRLQWDNALKSVSHCANWWAVKLIIHALIHRVINAVLGKSHYENR